VEVSKFYDLLHDFEINAGEIPRSDAQAGGIMTEQVYSKAKVLAAASRIQRQIHDERREALDAWDRLSFLTRLWRCFGGDIRRDYENLHSEWEKIVSRVAFKASESMKSNPLDDSMPLTDAEIDAIRENWWE
jgi:hypothetical protein